MHLVDGQSTPTLPVHQGPLPRIAQRRPPVVGMHGAVAPRDAISRFPARRESGLGKGARPSASTAATGYRRVPANIDQRPGGWRPKTFSERVFWEIVLLGRAQPFR